MLNNFQPASKLPEDIRVPEVADILNVKPRQVSKLAREGKLPCIRTRFHREPGRDALIFKRSQVLAYKAKRDSRMQTFVERWKTPDTENATSDQDQTLFLK